MLKLSIKVNNFLDKQKQLLKKQDGQNTIEYLFMLGIIVVVVGIVGVAIKKFMPDLFARIQEKIMGQADQI
jgi:Flp pilus assembly pilin Flp